MFRNWFRTWVVSRRLGRRGMKHASGSHRRSGRAVSPRTRPSVEEFEPRVTPSISVTVVGRVLTVDCDSSVNTDNYDANGTNTNVNGIIVTDSTFDSFQINIGTRDVPAH